MGTSGQRRELRRFIGAWLNDELHTGPSDGARKEIERDLARQGWFAKDGALAIGEPIRRASVAAPPPIAENELHPSVWRAAAPKWKADQWHDAVIAGAKAVNILLQRKTGRTDISEVQLVQEAFSRNEPTPTAPRLRFPDIEDAKTRESMTQGALSFGVGCFQAIRNPIGHLPDEAHELTRHEALERVAAFSLLARFIEQATLTTSSN